MTSPTDDLGAPTSLWRATAPDRTFPSLDRDIEVDVVVVGGGITGLTTAALLAAEGMAVAVVEARRLGNGTTGGTTGKVTSQHGLIYAQLIDAHGEDAARTYAEANEAGVTLVAELAERHDIACDLLQLPAYVHTEDPAQLRRIEQEVEAAQRLGLPASWTTDVGLPGDVHGAIRFDDQLQFHPLRYLHGLAAAIEAAGGHIFEGSRVHDVEGGERSRVVTDRGTVTTEHVVLATLIPILDRGFHFARAHPKREHGVAVTLDGQAPRGMYITAEDPSRSLRPVPGEDDDRLVVVGESHEPGTVEGTDEHHRRLADYARERYPVRSVDHRWGAQDYVPADGRPFIGRLARSAGDVHVATGFQKWGLSGGSAAAMIIRDAILGRRNPWAEFFAAQRAATVSSPGTMVQENLEVAEHFVADRVGTDVETIDDLGPGDGGIVEVDGEKLAVARGEDGAVRAVSPVCTHMGCYVQWNAGESSWDCPCHGSRFTTDGEVIEGPAVRQLDPHELPATEEPA